MTDKSKNKNKKNSMFSNQDTIVRRAWIESALESARSSRTENESDNYSHGHVALPLEGESAAESPAGSDSQQGLYLAWSSQERFSGT